MKKNLIIVFLIGFVIQSNSALSQLSDKEWDLMLIREDKVWPSMTDEYEMTLADLREFLSEKEVHSFHYFTHMQDDYRFTHVTPIQKFNDLSKGIHSFMSKEVNDPELDLIFNFLNESIESYRYYMVQYRPEYSYIAKGDDWGEGNPYRKWSYYYFHTGTEKEVEMILAAWKQLYQKKKINKGFRVFSGFLGVDQPLYILTTWAKDPSDYHANLENISGMLGENGIALWNKMMQHVRATETVEGWFLPQYSYAPGMKLAVD
ncbi:MAG: hypothetical protein PVH48_01305 [Cyclobacteriaceae bacterium]|jgi:hypothetical protein